MSFFLKCVNRVVEVGFEVVLDLLVDSKCFYYSGVVFFCVNFMEFYFFVGLIGSFIIGMFLL